MSLRQGFGIVLNTVEIAETVIGAITTQNLVTQTEDQQQSTAGEFRATHISVTAQNPMLSFSTHAVKKAHDAIGTRGVKITSDVSNPGVDVYQVKLGADGLPEAGSVHRKLQIRQGLLYPVRWYVDHQADLACDYELKVTWDGTNDPVAVVDSVALPAGLTDDVRWSYSKLTWESVAINDMISFELASGLTVNAIGTDSDHWPTHIEVPDFLPRATFRGLSPEDFASGTIPLVGKAGTHANSTVYFRKRNKCLASYVADGTAEHIKCTLAGCAYFDTLFNAGQNNRGEASIVMPLEYDGTNDPVTFDTASAIS